MLKPTLARRLAKTASYFASHLRSAMALRCTCGASFADLSMAINDISSSSNKQILF